MYFQGNRRHRNQTCEFSQLALLARLYLGQSQSKKALLSAGDACVVRERDRSVVAVGWPTEWQEGIAVRVLNGSLQQEEAWFKSFHSNKGEEGNDSERSERRGGESHRPRTDGPPHLQSTGPVEAVALSVGAFAAQGPRERMEDEHTIVMNTFDENVKSHSVCSYIGVYDGHGGTEAAHYLKQYLHGAIRNSHAFRTDVKTAMREAFARTDEALLDNARERRYESGAVAVSIIVRHRTAYICNCGDARAVLNRAGIALELSLDHTLQLQQERHRIEQCGGRVMRGRLNGLLAVSRAFGDLHLPPLSLSASGRLDEEGANAEGDSPYIDQKRWNRAKKMIGLTVEPRVSEEELDSEDKVR
uniref:PPM-type phosphatase domain-containing protein n=1 Tax=Palpitomonas bilix TaxID=652834 RepID=A0A7S3GD78_9EUKA|mmetsp:Transcript_44347/g.115248  ORF Transcript_44347/g.115248 Transcript_44347/m.115248 type:complete len:359 (+) Transcript_44347:59-1135(+)